VPKTLPGKDFGIDDPAVLVRVSTQKERKGKILKIKHPILGWIEPQVYYAFQAVVKELKRIDPLKLLAFITLTILYKPVIHAVDDVMDWFGDLFEGIGLAISGQLTPAVVVNIFTEMPILGGLFQTLFEALGMPQDVMTEAQAITGREGFINELQEWFFAAGAAAITITVGPSLVGALRP
jgi:hypothetical protein